MTDRTELRDAQRILVLSGAGLSTGAGIPDFRGPQGLWTKDPLAERISTLSWYLGDTEVRKKAWQYRAESPIWDAAPTRAHLAIVDLERQGRLLGIVTQNTDGLHQLAGSSPGLVHEVHGSARTWRCEDCRATGPMTEMVERVRAGEADPRCACGGIVRATTILFEEALDPDVLDAAVACAEGCDAIVAVGTGLGVHPVAGLFPYAIAHGAFGVIVNGEETAYDHLAHRIVRGDIQEALPLLLRA